MSAGRSAAVALAEPDAETTNRLVPMSAESRICRIDALLHAIFSTIHSDARTGDPGNVEAIGWLTTIAQDELRNLEAGLTVGKAMDVDCGV